MDQEADTGDHRQHGQRQTVQNRAETNVEVTDRHPRPQRLAERLFAVREEIDTDKGSDQRRQTDGADAHGCGEIF